jgi:RNA polymerase sigma factor (sigma-70 family)
VSDVEPIVFIVDDDHAVAGAIKRLLDSVGLRGQIFRTAQEFLDSPLRHGPGCLILDVRLPGPSGLDLQRELLRTRTTIPIIFITGHGDVPMSVQAMKAGAVEFFTKPFGDHQLLDAVQQALDQDRVARAQNAEREELRKRFESLTPREVAVMRLVVAGLLNKQIASRLGISEITVKVRRSRMMKKLKAKSPIELAHMAERLAISGASVVAVGGTELNRSAVTEEQTLPLPPPRRPPH